MEDFSKYSHSPAHLAVARRDHVGLRRLVGTLPRLPKAREVNTEEESISAELTADAVSAVIDNRDVLHRETPLHLAVRLRDPISAEILMSAGADWSLQNDQGWSALQEAVCTREDTIAMIIARHYQPLAWAKWCRRLPRIISSIARIRDFYMEITFHFESSVIPFIGRIAPSDTYRIWKQGSKLRADMTLAGFDGLRIQRSDQTFLFLGDGVSGERFNPLLPPGSLIVLSHKEKEITNALEGAGNRPTEAEVAHEVALMSQTNMYRPGIDVTQADLVSHLNWRRQERMEMVGNWKAKVYDMLHVMVSVKSRRVPGAMTDEELFSADNDERLVNGVGQDEFDDVLTADERIQLDSALRLGSSDGFDEDEVNGNSDFTKITESNASSKEKKSWFGWNNKKAFKSNNNEDADDLKIPKRSSKSTQENGNYKTESSREETADIKKGKEKNNSKKKKDGTTIESSKHESEYKKGLRPVLWLTPDFPLQTDELLPLLDILANKVKAIRRLRELLTTKLPHGTFPVKVSRTKSPTVGGDGSMFYFHGAKDEDFALVSDPNLHINARFIGFRPAGRSRNFTWVQAVAVMFDSHSLIVAARREAFWDDDADALDIIYGGNSVSIPGDSEAEWRILAEGPEREVSVERTAERTAEAIRVQLAVSGIVEMDLKAVAIGEEENRTHGHGLPAGDAFAHLEMQFKFGKLSNQVEGILGRTYRPGYISPAKRGVPMPVLGGRGLVPDSGIHVSPLQVLRRHSAVLKNPSRQRQ